MKIGEFAEKNNVTAKMLRYYDEIGLLKPSIIDETTGYRSYNAEQSNYLNWIIILKNLDFSLIKIKELLNGPVEVKTIVNELIQKRIEISSSMKVQIQKKIEIDRLISILEKEGFQMNKKIDLLSIDQKSVHEIKKNIPNMEMFLENAYNISSLCSENEDISVFRFDVYHFKQLNDDYGFDVGDSVIVICYNIIKENIEKSITHAALGRAHGDEFIVFAKAATDEIEKTAQDIVRDMENYDFQGMGCATQVGCRIGGLTGKKKSIPNIRMMIETSNETIYEAKKRGKNAVVIQPYAL